MWQGSAFDCVSSNNEIVLLHSKFSSEGYRQICNNGAIVGRSLRVQNDSFSSLLSVSVNSDMIGKDIRCVFDDGTTATLIGRQTITAGMYSSVRLI